MGDVARLKGPMTVEEFLRWDSGDDYVWELIDGFPRLKFAQTADLHGHAAPSDAHVLIIQNVASAIDAVLRSRQAPCRAYPGGGQTIAGARPPRHRIPDLVVKCGRLGQDVLQSILIVEVTSPSNTRAECAAREADYRAVPTIREIVTLEQSSPSARVVRRAGDLWPAELVHGVEKTLDLESIDLALPFVEIYRDVPLSAVSGA